MRAFLAATLTVDATSIEMAVPGSLLSSASFKLTVSPTPYADVVVSFNTPSGVEIQGNFATIHAGQVRYHVISLAPNFANDCRHKRQ